jgi:hypothetical protein
VGAPNLLPQLGTTANHTHTGALSRSVRTAESANSYLVEHIPDRLPGGGRALQLDVRRDALQISIGELLGV